MSKFEGIRSRPASSCGRNIYAELISVTATGISKVDVLVAIRMIGVGGA